MIYKSNHSIVSPIPIAYLAGVASYWFLGLTRTRMGMWAMSGGGSKDWVFPWRADAISPPT